MELTRPSQAEATGFAIRLGLERAYVETAAQWKSRWQARYTQSLLTRLAVYAFVPCISGVEIIWFFVSERVPITGRRRFSWSSKSSLTKMAEEERAAINVLRQNEEELFIKSDYPGFRKIEAVLQRIVKASGLGDISWDIRVLDLPNVVYASVFRSGFILITTGFFHHVISNDDKLAAVLGHEVAHVIARHRLESRCIAQAEKSFTLPFALLSSLTAIFPEAILALAPIMLTSYASLRLSRVREREADYIGLLLMVDAGFDPKGAVSLWTASNKWEEQQRRAQKKIRQDPQFACTHPHSASRITDMEKSIPEVLGILGGSLTAADQAVTQSRRVLATQRRWKEFAGKRNDKDRRSGEQSS